MAIATIIFIYLKPWITPAELMFDPVWTQLHIIEVPWKVTLLFLTLCGNLSGDGTNNLNNFSQSPGQDGLVASILFSSLLFHPILFSSIPFYSLLFYSIPFSYSILFHSILFYSAVGIVYLFLFVWHDIWIVRSHRLKCVSGIMTRWCVYDDRRARSTLPVHAWACGFFSDAFVFLSTSRHLRKPKREDQTPWNPWPETGGREEIEEEEDCSLASELSLHIKPFFSLFTAMKSISFQLSQCNSVFTHLVLVCFIRSNTEPVMTHLCSINKL